MVEHKTDVARLELMLEVGGIYLDTDSVIVRSLDGLRRYNVTLGEESDIDLGKCLPFHSKLPEQDFSVRAVWVTGLFDLDRYGLETFRSGYEIL